MILFAKEVTTRGDSYGVSSGRDGRTTFTATRTFIIKVDTSEDRSIDEVLAWLPQQGDSHPYIPEATVISVKVDLEGADPHIYLATVEYGDNDDEDKDGKKEDDSNPEYPWNQRATVVYKSDDSIKEVSPFAYAGWFPRLSDDPTLALLPEEVPHDITPDIPGVAIYAWPTHERFSNLPEEVSPSFGLQISMAIKGYKTIANRRKHDSSIVDSLKQQCFTVNANEVSLFGHDIRSYCGYLSSFTITPKYYLNKWRRVFAYYDISIQIADKPSSWIRMVQNMSMNRVHEDPNEQVASLVHIKLRDIETGIPERITSPVPIHPETGQPLAITADHQFDTTNKEMYVIPYLTKRPDDWDGLLYLNLINESRPLR